jgi:hypothetical protein
MIPAFGAMTLAAVGTPAARVQIPFALVPTILESVQTPQNCEPIPFAPVPRGLRMGAGHLRTCADSLRIRFACLRIETESLCMLAVTLRMRDGPLRTCTWGPLRRYRQFPHRAEGPSPLRPHSALGTWRLARECNETPWPYCRAPVPRIPPGNCRGEEDERRPNPDRRFWL